MTGAGRGPITPLSVMTRAEGPTLNTLNSAWGPPIFKEFKVSNPDPGRRTNFEQFELGVFKVFKVPPPANVPGLNFENLENDGGTTSFKVCKVVPPANWPEPGGATLKTLKWRWHHGG